MSVSKQDLEQIAFEIVAYSGDARSKLLQAVKEAKNKNFEVCRKLIEDAKECLASAHKSQTLFITSEAQGDNIEISFLTVHAQDHLMTTILLKDIIDSLLDIYI
ncbi:MULTISPECIES: PTS lactose/cellobiose transporter subunit IIA [Clostridium]|jgi:PTS system lactose-specific IIA component|uniref:PTS lactose/cellobiose transporter subunit IIA n=1 Tax=Clostridium TaxID=1485 RepID=UPI0002D18396|nr:MULTISPECIES: PTS lactose/cellobiose transporter subunit IIA [Clostridium]MDU5117788.1 PTS lactose/cellobiose transporter subunit IIA [Clostridium botulinum]ENZ30332.1 PTS system, lactose-specific IIa component [Clostridium butyricum 60E.3]KQB76821.1 PTS lactose transporter subunit IIA [Clostridium butyricum]MBS4843179.1 PTS lactose/cellobiose transporter subunit IIA [Clostridium sp.]MDB2139983.1 PTS lactose/cellobiose transporter subunit IIA [Clostridium butyricum]